MVKSYLNIKTLVEQCEEHLLDWHSPYCHRAVINTKYYTLLASQYTDFSTPYIETLRISKRRPYRIIRKNITRKQFALLYKEFFPKPTTLSLGDKVTPDNVSILTTVLFFK